MESKDKPIGYWVKQLDRLIELTLDQALVHEGLSRRDWQLMNVLHQEPATIQAIDDALEPFWGAGDVGSEVISGFVRRGWAQLGEDHRYGLTDRGEGALAGATRRVHVLRTLMTDGLTAVEYVATVDSLRRMATNLEAADRAATTAAAVQSESDSPSGDVVLPARVGLARRPIGITSCSEPVVSWDAWALPAALIPTLLK